MGGTDGQGELVPLIISQNVRKHFRVRVVAAGAIVKSDFIPMATAFQFQVPAQRRTTWGPLKTKFEKDGHDFCLEKDGLEILFLFLTVSTTKQYIIKHAIRRI